MPAVKKGDYILVSGASGFIAVHLCKDLLEKGYRVRGTVRSDAKGEYLKDLFKGKEFDYVIVDDITKDGVFDDSVKGVDAVAHTASPFHYNTNDPKDLIDPAYKGTTGILKSIQKNNPDIKRLVVTSSAASVMSTLSKPAGTKYTEKDWNEDSIGEIEKGGDHATPQQAYLASKTMAERALWDFVEKEKPTWDAATICPPSVWGAVLQQVDKKENLNTSVERFRCWAGGDKKEEDLPGFIGNWVAVRDVSHAHIAALEVPEAGGERFITSNGPVCGQDLVDIIHKNHPELKNVAVGKPGSGAEVDAQKDVFIGKKATDVLGIHYKSLEDTVAEMVESLSGKGWL